MINEFVALSDLRLDVPNSKINHINLTLAMNSIPNCLLRN